MTGSIKIGVEKVHINPYRPLWVPQEGEWVIYGAHLLWVWKNASGNFEIKEAVPTNVNPEAPLWRDWMEMSNVSAEEKKLIIRMAAENKLDL